MDDTLNSTSTAYESSRVVKSNPGTLFVINGYNSKVSAQFIQIYDNTAVPSNGDLPVVMFAVSAASNFSIDFGTNGRNFLRGIVVGNSSTGPTRTSGNGDCWYDVQYR